ncbi:hypothetical protein B0H14DRAFT_3871596 [Mycena olivaceomarginata]|nr:hypothetical protein B0H14DRAFT_3871596 [Mycena olivaceomarginata]
MSSSNKLADVFTSAQRLRELCRTTTSLHAYRRIAILAVEVCASATPDSRMKVAALAAYAAKSTDALINNGVGIPLSSERRQGLDKFESTLELIRRHIESVPERGTKAPKFGLAALALLPESRHLKAELDRVYRSLTSKARAALRKEYVLEAATICTWAASAICEVPLPGLSFLKPVVGMAALICDTMKDVTDSVVARARKASPQGNNSNVDSVAALRLVLEEVQAFLEHLQGWRCATLWLLAAKDKECFTELNPVLDRVLAVFCTSQSIAITAGMHGNTQELALL